MAEKRMEAVVRRYLRTAACGVRGLLWAVGMMVFFPAEASVPERTATPDTVRVSAYFRYGASGLAPEFRDNGGRLARFGNISAALLRDTTFRVSEIRVRAGASPEGNSAAQRQLTDRRGETIRRYLSESTGLPAARIEVESVGIDWTGLETLVAASDYAQRGEVLRILRETPEWISRGGKVVDGRKRQLQLLDGGRAWRDLAEHFFPQLRRVEVTLAGENMHRVLFADSIPAAPVIPAAPQRDTVVRVERDTLVVVERDTVVVMHYDTVVLTCRRERRPLSAALRTNMLYDAAAIPNIGIEFHLGRGWSLGGNWIYAWWNSDRRHRYWRIYGGDLLLRRYFGRRDSASPFAGHHAGLYGQLVTYDFETGGRGYLGDRWSWGGGVEYGYTLPVGRRLSLDFTLGVGYLGGEYKVYDPEDGCYVWKETRQRHWVGPTKAEISLVWLLGGRNVNERKGGKR